MILNYLTTSFYNMNNQRYQQLSLPGEQFCRILVLIPLFYTWAKNKWLHTFLFYEALYFLLAEKLLCIHCISQLKCNKIIPLLISWITSVFFQSLPNFLIFYHRLSTCTILQPPNKIWHRQNILKLDWKRWKYLPWCHGSNISATI